MRIAVSGSHSTGKSTLIASFMEKRPQYTYEPEAYELFADDISLSPTEGPDSEGLAVLLDHTISVLATHRRGASVIFERSPVDYLAYAAAAQTMASSERSDFLHSNIPAVRAAVCNLDLIVLLPVSSHIGARSGENLEYRERVDDELRSALIDDCYDLFGGDDGPRVLELPPAPTRQLSELVRRTGAGR